MFRLYITSIADEVVKAELKPLKANLRAVEKKIDDAILVVKTSLALGGVLFGAVKAWPQIKPFLFPAPPKVGTRERSIVSF